MLSEFKALIILYTAVDLIYAKSESKELFTQICQRMTEGAEQNDFVVFIGLLLIDDFKQAVKLRVIFRQIIGKIKDMFCHAGESTCVAAVQFFKVKVNIRVIVHLNEPSVDYIPYVRSKTENTACCLSADRTHHKRYRTGIV